MEELQTLKLPLDLLGHLIMLVFVAEGGSFSSASRALGKTPSTISRAITHLEERLHTQIFVRSRQAVRLTPAGEEIYRSCKAMHLAAVHVFDVCREQRQTLSGVLKIGGPKTLMKIVIAPVVRQFLARFPAMDVRMIADDRDYNFATEQIDILFKIATASNSNGQIRLGEVYYVLCASKGYMEFSAPVVTPQDLLKHRCMHFGETAKDSLWTFRKDGTETEVEVVGSFFINHSEALLEATEADMGIALLPNFVALPAIHERRLVQILPEYDIQWPHRGDLLMVSAFGANIPRRVSTFMQHIADSAEITQLLQGTQLT